MNKFGIAIILVAASVCLVSAAPKASRSVGSKHQHHNQQQQQQQQQQQYEVDTPEYRSSTGEPNHGLYYNQHEEPEEYERHAHRPSYRESRNDLGGRYENSDQYGNEEHSNQQGHLYGRHHPIDYTRDSEHYGNDDQSNHLGGQGEQDSHEREQHGYRKGAHKQGGFKHHQGNLHGRHHPIDYTSEPVENTRGRKHLGEREHEQQEFHHHGKHGGFRKGGLGLGHGQFGQFGGRSGSSSSSEDREASKGFVAAQEDERERIQADQQRVGLRTGTKSASGKQFAKNQSSDTGLRKHQQFNNDKTIIQDKSTGSNDVELNRRVSDSKSGSALAKKAAGTEVEFTNSRLEGERERERDLTGKQASFRDNSSESSDF